MSHISAYYQLEKLSEEVKKDWKIKSSARLDCVLFHYTLAEEPLLQFTNKKGQLFFYSSAPENYVIAKAKRISDIGLTHGSKHLSSIYIPNLEYSEFGHGDINGTNDSLLFKLKSDLSSIEMFLIKNGKHLTSQYFQQFIDGELVEEIEQIKKQAKPFFNYQNPLN